MSGRGGVGEASLARRMQKRVAVIQYIETTQDFKNATASARLARPDPEDASYSKRTWERALGHWRARVRSSAAQRGGYEIIEPSFPVSPMPKSRDVTADRRADSFYSPVRLYSESDLACAA